MISDQLKKIISFFATFLFLISISIPTSLLFAQNDQTGGGKSTGISYECYDAAKNVYGNCTFNDVILAVKKIVNYGTIFGLAFSVVVIAYAGVLYMTSGNSPGNIKKATEMFEKVAWGIFFILAAWMIVNLIVTQLVKPEIRNALPI